MADPSAPVRVRPNAAPVPAGLTRTALGQRLTAVWPELVGGPAPEAGDGELLVSLVAQVAGDGRQDTLWLLWTAVAAAMPTAGELLSAHRLLAACSVDRAALGMLGLCLGDAAARGHADRTIELVVGEVLVDVDKTARSRLHTGIARVVRNLLPRWADRAAVRPVVWAPGTALHRTLTPAENERVLRWDGRPTYGAQPDLETADWHLVVPWKSVVVLPEVPLPSACQRLVALAASGSSTVTAIGYDAIPVLNADLLPPLEPYRFVQYLSLVKHLTHVAAISGSAAEEFGGFVDMLGAQGLPGPTVSSCPLATELAGAVMVDLDAAAPPSSGVPSVLCVGSLEPRKNQVALMHAAERLWREGLSFELVLVAGGGWGGESLRQVKDLTRRGRPLRVLQAVTDQGLREAYAEARFTAFPSLHEGFGLPIAESLALGIPVLTTGYGSTAELAADGGAVLVDPRDDDALTDAMRALLTDDTLLARLREQIRARPVRTWDAYADEAWQQLVAPWLPGGVL